MKELWKDIDGYEGLYQVSNKGRVKSLDSVGSRNVPGLESYIVKGRVLSPSKHRHGYRLIMLRKDGHRGSFLVHRLVAKAFLQNPKSNRVVNHKDGVKDNNCVDNLEWVTNGENNQHAWNSGLRKKLYGSKSTNAKLTDSDVRHIKMGLLCGIQVGELSDIFEVSRATIGNIRTGKTYPNVSLNSVCCNLI